MKMYKCAFISEAMYGTRYYKPDTNTTYCFTEGEYQIFKQAVRVIEVIETENVEAAREVINASINRIKDLVQEEKIAQGTIEENIKKAKRVLILKSYGIGNLINMTPTVIKFHELCPDCVIDFFGESMAKEMFQDWNILNKVYSFPEENDQLKLNKYDFVLAGIHDLMMIANILPNVKLIKAPNNMLAYASEIEVNMQVLKPFGWDGRDMPHTYISEPTVSKERINKEFAGKKLISVCAGFRKDAAIWAIKNWGYKNYAELIAGILKKKEDYNICVLGQGDDTKILEYIQDERIINCVDKYTITESAQIIKLSDFIVCNDTGLAHVASALDVPSYVIFGPTSQSKNKPQNKSELISRNLTCQPCQHTWQWGKCVVPDCLNIPPDHIFNRIMKQKNSKYELGIIIPVFNRYYMTLMALDSLLHCGINKKMKFVIINDGSTDERVMKVIHEFKMKVEDGGAHAVIVNHAQNYGMENYWRTVRDGFENCSDCDYALYYANDIIVNPHLFEAVKASYGLFDDKVKCVQFFRDCRERKWGSNNVNKEFNKHFDYYFFDGVLGLFQTEDIRELSMNYNETGLPAWQEIDKEFERREWEIISLKETLAEHIGDIQSVMHPEYRNYEKLFAINLNLWDRPKILEDKSE